MTEQGNPEWRPRPPTITERVRDLEELARAVVRLVNRGEDLRSPPGIFVVRQLWAILEDTTSDDGAALGAWIDTAPPGAWDALFEGPLAPTLERKVAKR